jgi:predicted small lipoprotein YifL
MRIGTSLMAVALLVSLAVLVGCGGDGANNVPPANTTTVTGEVYGSNGGPFVPLGGQQVAIGNRTDTSDAGTGRFAITGIPAGNFTVVVTPLPGFGEVLNPDILTGTVAADQSVDIGRVLLGSFPPDPAN